jgi:predicted nucleic acid-binding protein
VKVVSDASPLIALARIDCLELLPKLYGNILISTEVYAETVIAGAGLPGAGQIAGAEWIEVSPVSDAAAVAETVRRTGLGAGEVSAILLAKEVAAGLMLIDERRARRYAKSEGLEVVGCVGILETLHQRGFLADLREAYARLLDHEFRIDKRALLGSLGETEATTVVVPSRSQPAHIYRLNPLKHLHGIGAAAPKTPVSLGPGEKHCP